MNNKRLETYRTYQHVLQTLLGMCGCWYMPTKSGKSTYFGTMCVLLVIIAYAIMNLHMVYTHRHNLMVMMKCIGLTISTCSTILKIGTFLINRGSLRNYHRMLNDLYEEELLRNDEIRMIMFSSIRTIRTVAYVYIAIIMTMTVTFFMPSYLSIIRDLCHLHLTTNYTLPVSRGFGYFWTVPHNFLYHIHLFFETVLVWVSSVTTSGVDSVFGFYVYQFASTMRAMTFRLSNPLPTENFTDILKTCVANHQGLLRCRDTLEHIYGPIVLWHVVTNAVLLCALIYEMMSVSHFSIFTIFSSVTYALLKFLQTFTYAWYGTILTNASDDFRKGIYFGEWPNSDLNRHVRTNVILMLMQKPMSINAFFFTVDMSMFTNFVNTTMSYFFLLQSVGDKGE